MRAICLILLTVLLLISCSEEQSLIPDFQEDLSAINQRYQIDRDPHVEDGYLVFPCEEVFESFILGLEKNGTSPESLSKRYGFESYLNGVKRTDQNEVIFGDEYFAGVLNKDGVVSIGNYIFKVDPVNEKTYALSRASSAKSQDAFLSKNTLSLPKGSLVFSFDDEVFYLLGKEVQCVPEEKCNEECASRDKEKRYERYCDSGSVSWEYEIEVKYEKVSIWKYARLTLKHEAYQGGSNNIVVIYDVRYDARWKKRCKDEKKESRDYVCDFIPDGLDIECFPLLLGPNTSTSYNYKNRFYHGTRCLSKYRFKADARLRNGCDGEFLQWTGFVEIRNGF